MQYSILVSGAGGYICSGLIKQLLEKGHKVIGVDNGFGRGLDSLIEFCANHNFTFIKGDVGSKKVLDQIEGKFQIAVLAHGLVGEPLCDRYPGLATQSNAMSIYNFCNRFPKHPVILTSTGSVYGAVEGICTEKSSKNGVSHYAKTKILAEEFVSHHSPYVIYRFATAFGLNTSSFRLDLLVNDLVYQACKNKTITLFQPDFRRTFCHVRDLVNSLIFAIENFNNLEGEIYNVGHNDNNWSKRKLAEFIKEKTGCSVFIGSDGYKDTDVRDYACSFEKINNKGWFAQISMEQGINELIKVFPLLNMKNSYNFVG